jgi:hypothetical protein
MRRNGSRTVHRVVKEARNFCLWNSTVHRVKVNIFNVIHILTNSSGVWRWPIGVA